jgi:hypothetical protein
VAKVNQSIEQTSDALDGKSEHDGWLSHWLSKQGPTTFSVWAIGAAFCVYFCMYAFRKPFTAGEFLGSVSILGVALPYKNLLVISQVLGYSCSKFIGVKLISETKRRHRPWVIVTAILAAEAALIGFAITPRPYCALFLFANGLPLGFVFGSVLAYLEGRRLTEVLAAGLCASFILSTGVVKSIGRSLVLDFNVSEYWMPSFVGAAFLLPLIIAVWCLKQVPPPASKDVELRSKRQPVTRTERWSFFFSHARGLTLLVLVYIGLTVIRSYRDDFAVEIWKELGEAKKPEIFAQTEFLVMLIVIALNGAAIWVRSNRTAFFGSLWLVTLGFVAAAASVVLYYLQVASPFVLMVGTGIGLYVPYVAFHTTVFERLIAASRWPGNIGFLIYIADSTGYLGYVGVLLAKSLGRESQHTLTFFLVGTLVLCGVCMLMTQLGAMSFQLTLPDEQNKAATAEGGVDE